MKKIFHLHYNNLENLHIFVESFDKFNKKSTKLFPFKYLVFPSSLWWLTKILTKLNFYVIKQLSFKIGYLIDFSAKGFDCIHFVGCNFPTFRIQSAVVTSELSMQIL